MKKNKLGTFLTVVSIASITGFSACKKKDPVEPVVDATKTETQSSADLNSAEKMSNDLANIGSDVSENPNKTSMRAYGAATVTRDSLTKTITVTYGGTMCLDGHTRSGSLIFNYASSVNNAKFYRNPGYTMEVRSSNFVVDGDAVSVHKLMVNNTASGFDPKTTNLTWSMTDTILITKSSGIFKFIAAKTKTLLNTSDTTVYHGQGKAISWEKASIGITGGSTGTTATGETYSTTITSQLISDGNCSPYAINPNYHPFIKGTVQFVPLNKPVRTLDFGTGTCDDIFTVTINGKTVTL